MEASTGSAAARELLVVFALASAGLLLAVLAAFAPWYPAPDGEASPVVVELRSPTTAKTVSGFTSAGAR